MRKVFTFLVWLFSFWTWQDFFLCWLRSPATHPPSGETTEHLPPQEGQHESKFACFLSSLPEAGCKCRSLTFRGDSNLRIRYDGHSKEFTFVHGINGEASSREFFEAVASSQIVFHERVNIFVFKDESFKHVEAFADAFRQSCTKFRKLRLNFKNGSAVQFAKCVSSVLLGNDVIEHLDLRFGYLKDVMGKDVAREFMGIIGVPRILRILKAFAMSKTELDGEGMQQLMQPFQGPFNVLEDLVFYSPLCDAQFDQISGMLASSTSLKNLQLFRASSVEEPLTRGYESIATALGSNQSLESLSCDIFNRMELKALLDPLMPKNNNLQCNTTLTKLSLCNSIGGKEGIETLVDFIRTNSSLLHLELHQVDDLSLNDTQGIENVLAILEALKTNKSLKIVDFFSCSAVGGYQVLGAMMDLLLENHNIEDIGLDESGDADYVYSALSKKKKMKLWDIVQNMATVNPTSGRVFLCGEPFASMYSCL